MDDDPMSRGTTHRAIRIDAELWERVKTQAATEGITVSELIRQLLRGWLDKHDDNKGES